jgi:hypothetical protein
MMRSHRFLEASLGGKPAPTACHQAVGIIGFSKREKEETRLARDQFEKAPASDQLRCVSQGYQVWRKLGNPEIAQLV